MPLLVLIIGALIWLNASSQDYPPAWHHKAMLQIQTIAQGEGEPEGTFLEREAISALRGLQKPYTQQAEADRGDGRVRYIFRGAEGGVVQIIFDEGESGIIEVNREET